MVAQYRAFVAEANTDYAVYGVLLNSQFNAYGRQCKQHYFALSSRQLGRPTNNCSSPAETE